MIHRPDLEAEQHRAQEQQPSLLWMLPKPSFMHSRYSPTTAMAMLTHSCALPLRPRNRPNTGTSTIKHGGRKPAFAVEGSSVMPSCCAPRWLKTAACRTQARLSAAACALPSFWGLPSGLPCRWCKASNALTVGSSTSTAIQLRPPERRTRPCRNRRSAPQKAVPQIRGAQHQQH